VQPSGCGWRIDPALSYVCNELLLIWGLYGAQTYMKSGEGCGHGFHLHGWMLALRRKLVICMIGWLPRSLPNLKEVLTFPNQVLGMRCGSHLAAA
jgi:hypothetical protein